jgi:serine/threonine protein kinase
MKTIRIDSFLSTNIELEFASIKTIEIEDDSLGEGGFGIAYLGVSINKRKPFKAQIIKIFKEDSNNRLDHNFETIQKLQKKLDQKNKELLKTKGKSITEAFTVLKAIPQFSFSGTLKGKTVRGYSSSNLKKLGFEEFKDILTDDKLYKEYFKVELKKKLLIAYNLVAGFKLLSELYFIHADLKDEAIFINSTTNECAIIDFDSGAVTENINDEPNTWGAPTDWLAPEIYEQLKASGASGKQKIKVNLFSDLWSVTVGVHYIITTIHPLFFLKELSPRVTKQYFSKYQWPDIKPSESYFENRNQNIYDSMMKWYPKGINQSIFNEFKNTINHGYNKPINRTTYERWERALKSIQKPSEIEVFDSDRKSILKGMPVLLFWKVNGATTVEINNGIGKVPNNGSKEIYLNDNTNLEITATGMFGNDSKNLLIKVYPTPTIKTIDVPVPNIQFNTSVNISIIRPSSINLNKVEMNFSTLKSDDILKKNEYSRPLIDAKKEQKKIKKRLRNISIQKQLSKSYEGIKERVSKFFSK